MNDSSNSLPPSGDDALEARIVAWVLGEASPFEAAELEKLCAENSKLREFERRMRDLNGILAADAKPVTGLEWKLPAGKREKVTDLLGVASEAPAEGKVNRYFARRILLAAAACVAISLVSYPLFSGGVIKMRKSVASESAKTVDFLPSSGGGGEPAGSLELGDAVADRTGRVSGMREDRAGLPEDRAERASRRIAPPPGQIKSRERALAEELEVSDAEVGLALNEPTAPAAPAATAMPAEPAKEIAEIAELADGAGKKLGADDKPSDPADLHYRGWLESREGERLKEQGNVAEAQKKLADARDKFERVQQRHPGWKEDMVGGRLANTEEQLAQIAEAMPESESRSELATVAGAKSDGVHGLDLKAREVPLLAKPMAGLPPSRTTAGGAEGAFPGMKTEGSGGSGVVTGGARSGEAQVNRNDIDAAISPAGGSAGVEFQAGQEVAGRPGHTSLLSDAAQGGSKVNLALDFSGPLAKEPALMLGPEDVLAHRFSRQEIVPRKPGEMPIQDAGAAEGYTMRVPGSSLAWSDADTPTGNGDRMTWSVNDALNAGGVDRSAVAAAEKFFFGSASAASGFAGESRGLDQPRQLVLGGGLHYKDPASELPQLQWGVQPAPATPATGMDLESDKVVAEAVDQVRRSLHLAEGAYNLGKYDDAAKAYEDVIRVDPSNKAARRGMEQVAQAKTDYYRAAYDQTRAELLAEVDKAWELQVPPVAATQPAAEAKGTTSLSGLAQKEVARREATVAEADRFVEEGRRAWESGDLEKAYKMQLEGLGRLPEAPVVDARRVEVKRSLSEIATGLAVDAKAKGNKNAAKEWAGKALQWNPQQKEAKEILDLGGGDETSAVAEPFSTFSLHVSDASFKLAKAALDRGDQPDPAGIRPEEFYNAFDYGDPAPAQGEPVVCVTEQSAHPILPQRNLVRIGVRTAAAGRGGSTPLNLTLLLDSSGSMEREDRQAAMLRAVDQLSKLLKEGDTITVAGFARQPRLLADRLPGARARELNTIIAQTPSEGGTNLEEGLKLAEELAKRQFNGAAQNRIVLFTDGAANLGDAQPESLQARVEQLRQRGIAFDAAGFGADGLNDRLLERLTRNGNGRYYVVDRAEDAGEGFAKQLAGAFRPAAENVKVKVRFNPARVARYKLIGFEEHRLAKEDFKNDAVDAAEMAAEEAGNALYQIQPIPGGEGEIGEVSVRFRDVASGQMVERTWTIPYEAQAPAFDRAAPSMQLAGLAMFAAEKLRKAPMAEAIDFDQLGKALAPVKARYAGSAAVGELGGMIEKLR